MFNPENNNYIHSSSSKTKFTAIALVIVFLLALSIRLLPIVSALQTGEIIFWGTDSYDHLRRIVWTTNHFPSTFQMNFYQGFPEGTPNLWPPLIHLVVAGCSLVLGLGTPSLSLIEWVAAIFPAVIGALCIFPVFSIGKQLGGRLTGVFAALTLTFLPAHITLTLFGMIDNNAVEPFLAALLFATATPYILSQDNSTDKIDLPGHAWFSFDLCVLKKGIIIGVVGWVFLFTWRGAIMFHLIIIGFGVIQAFIYSQRKASHTHYFLMLATACAFWAIATFPFVIIETWGAQNSFKVGTISWFHVLVSTCATLFFLLFANSKTSKFIIKHRQLAWGTCIATLILVFVWAVTIKNNSFNSQDVDLFRLFLGQNNLWGIAEFSNMIWNGNSFHTDSAFYYFVWASLIAPIVWLILCIRSLSNRFSPDNFSFFLFWSLILLIIGIMRIRFVALSAIPVALLIGLLANYISRYIILSRWKISGAFLALVITTAILSPAWATITTLPKTNYKLPMTEDLFSALKWMRVNTPPTGVYDEPWLKPKYGVLASWDFGSWIEYIAHRPAVATPWGDEAYGLIPQAQFFLSTDNNEADAILKKNQVKYVIISNTMGKIKHFAGMLGVPHNQYYSEVKNASGKIVDTVNAKGIKLVSLRLFLNDGLPLTGISLNENPPENLRLIHESSGTIDMVGTQKKISRIKIFERVAGAVLTGNATAGELIKIEIDLSSNRGRNFTWATVVKADVSGTFTATVPYSTTTNNNATSAKSKYKIKTSDTIYTVSVTEHDIENHQYILCEKN